MSEGFGVVCACISFISLFIYSHFTLLYSHFTFSLTLLYFTLISLLSYTSTALPFSRLHVFSFLTVSLVALFYSLFFFLLHCLHFHTHLYYFYPAFIH
ncbi:hypothetical protein, unlikely [Trypanosoma brucei brucei TREU927]|uniref:T. brucei spp.-specific protein n=1 Tax=Trypanosoma brucei brucei (strain 927/4 GUTat10.1) TaxID=185431 RepID=Q4GYH7_TRYB2|nr:hypothetical protein, unlikely [Trypanosoma brucei brucei TREU927]CAJ16607.1 hypothetical protein, unlikely [Trypanosoma brucei brucei TREU927]